MIARVSQTSEIQGPKPAEATATESSGFWASVLETVKDPTFLEIAAITLVVLTIVWFVWSLRRGLRKLHGRRLLVKYLDGVQAQSAGDPELAVTLLREVVDADPENLGARIAYGGALAALGRSAEAHEQHVEAQESFGATGPGIELALVQELRASGETPEALAHLERALTKFPRDEDLLRNAFEVRSEAGMYEAALEAGRRLSTRRTDPQLRATLASVAVRAGMRELARKDRVAAERLFREALGYEPQNAEAASGLDLLRGDARSALMPRALAGGVSRAALPEPRAAGTIVIARDASSSGASIEDGAAATGRGLAAILSFFPDARCAECGAARSAAEPSCPSCDSLEPAVYGEEGLDEEIFDAKLAFDEIEENDRWFARLAEALRKGDSNVHALLVAGGERALLPILRCAITHASNADLEALLVDLGRRHPEALLVARDTIQGETKGILEGSRMLLERAGGLPPRRTVDDVLSPVLRAVGDAGRGAIDQVMDEPTRIADRGMRSLVLDWFVGLAELEVFQDLGRRFAPVEIVRRLNQTPDDALVPLFEQMPAGRSFLRDAILLDPALDRPRALVRAALRAWGQDPKSLPRWKELFAARGPGQRVLGHLVSALRSPDFAVGAESLLESFRHEALEQLVSAFADPDAKPESLDAHARLLKATGAEAADGLVRCFSSSPSEADDRVIEVLSSIGKPAIAKLEAAYKGKVGWLGAIGAKRFLGKHPRGCIARAIASIPQRAAEKSLEKLSTWETEPDLESLLRELLRRHREGSA